MKSNFLQLSLILGALVPLAVDCIRAQDLPVVAWQGRTMGSDYVVKIVDCEAHRNPSEPAQGGNRKDP